MKDGMALLCGACVLLAALAGCAAVSACVTPVSAEAEPGSGANAAPDRAPQLDVLLSEPGASAQSVRAAQLTTSWTYTAEDGSGAGYEADSPHPLQLQSYDGYTLISNGGSGEIELRFADYRPKSVSARRWDAAHIGTEDTAVFDAGGEVELDGHTFALEGGDAVYAVFARWEEGSSAYAFRVTPRPAAP